MQILPALKKINDFSHLGTSWLLLSLQQQLHLPWVPCPFSLFRSRFKVSVMILAVWKFCFGCQRDYKMDIGQNRSQRFIQKGSKAVITEVIRFSVNLVAIGNYSSTLIPVFNSPSFCQLQLIMLTANSMQEKIKARNYFLFAAWNMSNSPSLLKYTNLT